MWFRCLEAHQLELENRSLHAKWTDTEEKYVALNELTARETELLTNKLQVRTSLRWVICGYQTTGLR